MSHHLTQVTVLGLWGGDEVLRLKFDRQFNFLIGKNGSGKTTLINLLAAVLLADFESLDKIQFTEVVVHLKPLVGQKRPRIVVTKTGKKNLPYADIAYKIWLSSKESIEFDLDALAEEQSYRGLPNRYLRDRVFHERFVFVQTQLKELLDVTWLSVHRGPDELDRKDERRVIPAVDRKLASLNIELVKYFSRLAKDFEGATDEFQKKSFLSLTNVDEFSNVKTFAETVDTRAEATALASVFDLLGVSKDAYEGPLNKGLETFDGAREKFLSKSSMTFADIFSVSNAYRAHALVQFYDVLREQREKIFKPRDGFLRVLNSLLNPINVT